MWIVAAVLVLLLYPLSFGPACWLADRQLISTELLHRAYYPVFQWAMNEPRTVGRAAMWYAESGMKRGSNVVIHSYDYSLIIWNDGTHKMHFVRR